VFTTLTGVVSAAGIVSALVYMYKLGNLYGEEELKKEVGDLTSKIKKVLNSNKEDGIELIVKDYETSCKEIERRDHITLLIGTVLITAATLVFNAGFSAHPSARFLLASVSILLFSVWLWAMHYTSVRLNNLSYIRIRAIEEALSGHLTNKATEKALSDDVTYKFGIHQYLFEKTQRQDWIKFRRWLWGYVSLLLGFGWLFTVFLGL
jgi:hypothetical protein